MTIATIASPLIRAPVHAQLSSQPALRVIVGADATLATRYVWRGFLRTDGVVVQPQAWVGLGRGSHILSFGAWSTYAPGAAEPGEIDFGRDPGEVEGWIEIGGRIPYLDWSLGFVMHDGRGTRPVGLLPAAFDTQELRVLALLRDGLLRRALNLTPSVRVAFDVGDVGGQYWEADLEYAATLLPEPRAIPFSSLFFGVTAGWSDGMSFGTGADTTAYYAGDGLTHIQARALVSFTPVESVPLVVHVARQDRWAKDDAVRRVSTDPLARGRHHLGWWEFTVSLRFDAVRFHD
ncbi:MAG: hypothetical protein L0271_16465 [Gemmatimonadetes bacterium]|nr:hypothetical protein [Gemmatimonadota bacterium]